MSNSLQRYVLQLLFYWPAASNIEGLALDISPSTVKHVHAMKLCFKTTFYSTCASNIEEVCSDISLSNDNSSTCIEIDKYPKLN